MYVSFLPSGMYLLSFVSCIRSNVKKKNDSYGRYHVLLDTYLVPVVLPLPVIL